MKRILQFIIGALFICILFVNPSTIYAAEKNIEIELDKDYSSCTFKLVFQNAGSYKAELIDSQGNTYSYGIIDDMTMTCTVSKIKKGTYITHITSDLQTDIGKVTISVTSAAESTTDIVDDNISIGRDISGLKMFFKDDEFIATWTDDTCGDVAIQVINLDTAETISNEKVSTKEFSCEIPLGVKNISVIIVPATSANIEGAALNYSFEVDNNPNANVVFPNYKKTNLEQIPIKAILHDTYSIYVEVNNKAVIETEMLKPGEYDYNIPMEADGENIIKFYIVDKDGNMRSTEASYIKDTVAPTLTLNEEYDGREITDDSICISGYVTNYDTFTINNEVVDIATDGYFSKDCTLHVGENRIVVVAADEAGNETKYEMTIIEIEKEAKSGQVIFAFVMLLVVSIIIIANKKRKKGIKNKASRNHFKSREAGESSAFEQVVNIRNEEDKRKEEDEENDDEEIDKTVKTEKKKGSMKKLSIPQRKIIKSEEETMKEKFRKKFLSKNKPSVGGNKTMENKLRNCDYVKYAVIIAGALIIFKGILFVGYASSGSMIPTIKVGDCTVSNRLAYVAREPARGDIVLFEKDGKILGKRVVGIENDIVELIDGYVYINGELLDESEYLDADIETNSNKSFEVPEGCVFVLGDNRENSLDSRYWENPYVPFSDIKAKLLFVIPTHVLFGN